LGIQDIYFDIMYRYIVSPRMSVEKRHRISGNTAAFNKATNFLNYVFG